MKVILLPQAQEDLGGIEHPLLARVLKRLGALRRYPDLGAPMVGPFAGYRSSVVGLFRIVYKRPSPDLIQVAYIRHCRRK